MNPTIGTTPQSLFTPGTAGYDTNNQQPYGITKKEHQTINMPAAQNQKPEKSQRNFLGKMVYALKNPGQTFKDISCVTQALLKDLADYTVDSLASMAVMVKGMFRYTAYGAASGLIAGAAISVYNPLMAPTIIPFSVGCGASAGAIFGAIRGADKASDHFDMLQQQRREVEEQAAINHARLDLNTAWV